MLHRALVEGNRPVRRIVTHGRGDGEALRQLGIDADFFREIHVLRHAPLHALAILGIAVRKDEILDVLLRAVSPGEVAVLFSGEDGAVVGSLRAAVGDLFHDHRGFLLIDEADSLDDEFLRVVAEHGELIGTDAVQNPCRASAGELGTLGNLADEVIGHLATFRTVEGIGLALFRHESLTTLQVVGAPVLFLLTGGDGVLELCHEHLIVDMVDGLADQLLAVKLHGICVPAVDEAPQPLKFPLVEIIVQRVLGDLRVVTVLDHIVQGVRVEDALDQGMDAIADFRAAFRNRREDVVFLIGAVLVGNMVILVDIVVLDEVAVNVASLLVGDGEFASFQHQRLADGDAMDMPFSQDYFDTIISVDAYHYFGCKEGIFTDKVLPYVKKGGFVMIAFPGLKEQPQGEMKQLFETWAEGNDSELFKTAVWWENLLKDECKDRCSIEVKEAECYDIAWQEWFRSGHEYGVRDKSFLDQGLYDILNFLLIYIKKE